MSSALAEGIVRSAQFARGARSDRAENYQALLDGCTRLRDRSLLQLLRETGMRIGEGLGLRHEYLSIARHEVAIRLNEKYGDLDSDFVFVNLGA